MCGRNETAYNSLKIAIKPHVTYIPYTLIKLCKFYNRLECKNVYLYIGILTRPECLYERLITRRILNNIKYINYIFITGFSLDEYINLMLSKEVNYYSDIIRFNIINSYYNSSLIMSCFYLYLFKNCQNIKWIMKLDIDTYFNPHKIFDLLHNLNNNISVIGSINKNSKLKCNSNNKWSIKCGNKNQSFLHIPSYPYGPAFIFKFSIISCINTYFINRNEIIWIEDIFFGILMHYCHLKYLDISNITEITYKPKYNLSITRNNIFIHGLNPIEIFLANKLYLNNKV